MNNTDTLVVKFDKDFPKKLHVASSVECIPGLYENYYNDFDFTFWTLDFNAEKICGNKSFFKSDPWMLIHKYLLERKKFECDAIYEPNKKFICLIFDSTKDHRKVIYDFILTNDLDCYVSRIDQNIRLTEIPEHYKNGYHKNNFNYGVPKEYFMSLIEFVSETFVKFSSHFSEKTFKPLFYKKPFVTFAGPYYYETLKKYNFELYNELFDYSFDKNESPDERLSDILIQIKELNKLNFRELESIIEKISDKIEYNYNTLLNIKSKFHTMNSKHDEQILRFDV